MDTWQQIRKGRRAKNRVFATVPHGAQAAASKPLKYTVNRLRRCDSIQAPALRGVDTWQQIRKGRRAKNRVFATVPHGAQAAASKPLKYTVNRLRRCEVWIRGWDVCRAVYKFRRCEVWIHGWDVCRGWTKACMSWLSKQCFALLFPYASPSGKAEGSADN